jgi:hypothetical protein
MPVKNRLCQCGKRAKYKLPQDASCSFCSKCQTMPFWPMALVSHVTLRKLGTPTAKVQPNYFAYITSYQKASTLKHVKDVIAVIYPPMECQVQRSVFGVLIAHLEIQHLSMFQVECARFVEQPSLRLERTNSLLAVANTN